MIHLYGVTQDLEELPALAGLDGSPLERWRIEGLDLVVSRVELDRPEVSQDAVLRHAEVVEELLTRSRSVLPAQFGRAFADEEELSKAVRTKATDLRRSLTRVSGCVEFGLRVVGSGTSDVGARDDGSGRSYMRARLAESKERDRVSQKLHEPLAQLSRESVRFSGGELLVAAYLVPVAEAAVFGQQVRGLEAAHPELTVVCTGPWPPYSFAVDPQEGQG
jgi:gas vesicle protein GvpL/GvpF